MLEFRRLGVSAARLMLAGCLCASAANAQQAASPAAPEPSVNTAFLQSQDDVSTVVQLVMRERQGRDRGWWSQMTSTYWPDARVDLTWYHGNAAGFISGSRAMHERGARPVHRMFTPAVDIRGNKAHVEAPALTWSTLTIKGKEANFETSMRLNYRLEKRGREWRILSLAVIYEYATVSAAAPGETLDIPAAELAKFRKSYALLSWNQAQRGTQLSQDELGVDRPEEVQKFYDEIKRWLNS